MALAENSDRMRIATYVLKDSKAKLEEMSKKCNVSQSKMLDMAINMLYDKIKEDGITLKLD